MSALKSYFHFGACTRAAFRLFFATLVFFSLARGAFYLAFYKQAENFNPTEVTQAFWLGFRFDIRISIFLALPLLIFSLVKAWDWSKHPQISKNWVIMYTLIYSLVILSYGTDFGYYAYLESRLSFRIFEFFKNPLISLEMLMQSYNLVLLVVVYVVLIGLTHVFLKKWIFQRHPSETTPHVKTKKMLATQSLALSLLIVIGIHNNLSQYPLRWSDTFFTQNIFIASLAMNPIHYLFDTAENSQRNYDLDKTRQHYDVTARYLGVKDTNRETLNFIRPIEMSAQFHSRPNIVYIVMESMAAYKTGAFGNPANPSPSLDEAAKDGWLFTNFYVPTEGTARSLFCILAGVPDINAKSTSSRNPHIVDQHTSINGFAGYDKFYFIGGNAAWGNIRGVYMNNVVGLQFYEDQNLEGPRTDVWGLSDLHLFREAARILDKNHQTNPSKPFFALIQAASYHRPYTIPDDAGDFQKRTLTTDELNTYGFASNEEFNSFRFSDYALGEFLKLAKKSPYYANTIFVIHGDHGLPHHSAKHISEGYKHFGLNRFHTPLVMHSPLFDRLQIIDRIVTEPDVLPTLLGLTGNTFLTRTLGRNIFGASDSAMNRYAFSYVYYSSPLQIMLYDQNLLLFANENKILSLHEYNLPHYKQDVRTQHPEKFEEMSELLQGIYESSRYLLHHNPKIK